MPGKLFYKLCKLCGITETFPQKSTCFIEKQSLFLIGNLLTERKKIVRIFDFFQDEPRLFFKHNFCLLSKTVRGNYITIGTELTEENFRSLRMIRIGRMKA